MLWLFRGGSQTGGVCSIAVVGHGVELGLCGSRRGRMDRARVGEQSVWVSGICGEGRDCGAL